MSQIHAMPYHCGANGFSLRLESSERRGDLATYNVWCPTLRTDCRLPPSVNDQQPSPSAGLSLHLSGAVKAEVNILTRRERQSVTLHTGLTGLQADKIFWFFGPVIPNTSIVESQVIRGENITEFKGRFPDRLQLDRQTGSLTIRNLTLSNSGVYQIDIFNTHKTSQRFYRTVYALVPLPQVRKIPGDFLDSSSGKGSCSVVCSVENRRDMTLSWYRGEKRLNQTSSPDLSTNLALPLEIKLQDKDIYSCVAANPVSNQTTKLNIETLCLQFITQLNSWSFREMNHLLRWRSLARLMFILLYFVIEVLCASQQTVQSEIQQVKGIVGQSFSFPERVIKSGNLLYGELGSIANVFPGKEGNITLVKRFENRLHLNNVTRYFTLSDIQIDDAGLYTLEITDEGKNVTTFELTVYSKCVFVCCILQKHLI
ncbi:uncharacterized protein LOC120052181 [Salvelinus namaycush]|uniref:Uncharacterized protein LOC120052181 n=1 Tax=Salvelinus namaycush TaxID=8040 RepID=A0A8U0R4H1_SALNM|nr:uncharacterized protein LOC120052181 [Salvelinus namaycush]